MQAPTMTKPIISHKLENVFAELNEPADTIIVVPFPEISLNA